MSLIFTLSGFTSSLSTDFYPPIELDGQYNLALLGFYTYNSIWNIDNTNNKFHCKLKDGKEIIIAIPCGAYEITDIEKQVRSQVLEEVKVKNEKEKPSFYMHPNNNTLKVEIRADFEIDFTPQDSIGNVLGFSKQVLPLNIEHVSDLPVNIVKVRAIRVESNLVTGSYNENKSSHTLYEFTPTVDPGFAIDIEPRNLIYLPIIDTKSISNITINIRDQNNELIDFHGEQIIVRLELKKHGI